MNAMLLYSIDIHNGLILKSCICLHNRIIEVIVMQVL